MLTPVRSYCNFPHRSLTPSSNGDAARFCDRCQLASMDDVRHLVLQCPFMQDARNALFRELSEVDNGRGQVILASPGDTLY